MKLMVLSCAVFESEEEARKKLWIYLRSCEKYDIEPHLYGMGRRFPAYRMMKLDYQLEYLEAYRDVGYSHVLYTDAWDAFFTAPLDEIIRKYEEMGSPRILASASPWPWPGEKWDGLEGAWPHVGGYLAEMPAIIDAFQNMLKQPEQTGDDCYNWWAAWQDGSFRPTLDSKCEIFQVGVANQSGDPTCEVESSGRLHNIVTGTRPCILHLPGGYTDPQYGKDSTMIPWARKLGIIDSEEVGNKQPRIGVPSFERAWAYTNQIQGAFTRLSAAKYYEYALQTDDLIVEVGVDQGRSASLAMMAAERTGASVVLVDSWESVLIDNKAKVEEMCSEFPTVEVRIINAKSTDAAPLVDGPIGFIHIDANHYHPNPSNDCEAWLPKLRSGGIGLWHDYNSCFDGVNPAVDKYTAGWEDLGVWDGLAIRRKP